MGQVRTRGLSKCLTVVRALDLTSDYHLIIPSPTLSGVRPGAPRPSPPTLAHQERRN